MTPPGIRGACAQRRPPSPLVTFLTGYRRRKPPEFGYDEAAAVADKLNATLVDMRFVKPLDTALILQLAGEHDVLVTLEENAIMGGAGSGVNEVLMAHRRAVPVLNIGLPDVFIPQGTQEEIRADLGLDAAGIEAKILDWLA